MNVVIVLCLLALLCCVNPSHAAQLNEKLIADDEEKQLPVIIATPVSNPVSGASDYHSLQSTLPQQSTDLSLRESAQDKLCEFLGCLFASAYNLVWLVAALVSFIIRRPCVSLVITVAVVIGLLILVHYVNQVDFSISY